MSEPFIKQLRLTNLLSFGPDTEPLTLHSLNLLIGPNGTGKSNLVEALSVLRAAASDVSVPIRRGGGIADWLHRGEQRATSASIETVFAAEMHLHRDVPGREDQGMPSLRHFLSIGSEGGALVVLDEWVESAAAVPDGSPPILYYGYEEGNPRGIRFISNKLRVWSFGKVDRNQSVLSQRRDPQTYPELTRLAEQLGRIAIYRDWVFGPGAPVRESARADSRSDRLNESLDNLAVRISALSRDPAVKRKLIAHLADVAPGFSDIVVVAEGGRLQLYLTEGDDNVAAHRLSDGTLRYLVLLAILLDPSPPPLVVIEEPEMGLHFDLVAKLAGLLRDARTRMQLVVTTHSEALVDAFSDEPEVVLVCEKRGATTHLERLSREDLAEWLKSYSLGEIWRRGEIGGTRS